LALPSCFHKKRRECTNQAPQIETASVFSLCPGAGNKGFATWHWLKCAQFRSQGSEFVRKSGKFISRLKNVMGAIALRAVVTSRFDAIPNRFQRMFDALLFRHRARASIKVSIAVAVYTFMRRLLLKNL